MKKKVLLIDDNVFENATFINNLRYQYKVDAASRIVSARSKLKESVEYDLIVLDVGMPAFQAFELGETLDGLITGFVYYEKELIHLNIPVLFWSCNKDFLKVLADKKWPNTGFLLKGLDEDHLLLGVNQFFEKSI